MQIFAGVPRGGSVKFNVEQEHVFITYIIGIAHLCTLVTKLVRNQR